MMTTMSWGARLGLLALALSLGLIWAGVAHAQDSFGDQYGSPVDSGEAAIESTDSAATATAAATSASGGITTGVLPLTGGPLLPFVALGMLSLSTIGLLAFRRSGRQRQDT